MTKKKNSGNVKRVIRVRRRCYLVENLKKIRLCRKCNETLEKSRGFGKRCPRCNLYYVDMHTYKKFEDVYILLNPEFLQKGFRDLRTPIKKTTVFEHKDDPSMDSASITAHDFVVRSNVFICSNKEHTLQDIQAEFTIFDRQGNISKLVIPAGYCPNCNTYYVMDSVFRQIEDKGIPICRTSDLKNEVNVLSDDHNSSVYNRIASESILKKFGYSVSQKQDLPEDRRRNILAAIIDFDLLTKSELDSYLSFYINTKKNQRRADGSLQYGVAIEKWESDRRWLSCYKIGSLKEIQARRIIINKRN